MSGIIGNTFKNIFRNKWLSIATILVATIVFTASSFFIALTLIAQRAVSISETKAQLQVYFQIDTPEEEITSLKKDLSELDGVNSITYIDKEEALKIYMDYYSDDPELVDSVSADWLPASLEIQANTLDDLEGITKFVKNEQNTNPYIEEVQYHEDVVNQLKSLSKGISVGAIMIIVIFSLITISLVVISIAFNINSHKHEIEIMHLVGSTDSFIRTPFILEGVFYTAIGAVVSATLIILPWYLLMYYGNDSNIQFILKELAKELNLDYLTTFNWRFVLSFYLVHILLGSLLGFLSSLFSVMRNLKLKEK